MTHVALCCLQAFERLAENIDPLAAQHQRALYSSTLGGIVTHPAYMFIHFDDHLVQRAHGVCEDIVICEGYLYQMEEHLGRLLASAELAGLELGVSEATLRRIVLDTAAASMLMNGGCMLGVHPHPPWPGMPASCASRRCSIVSGGAWPLQHHLTAVTQVINYPSVTLLHYRPFHKACHGLYRLAGSPCTCVRMSLLCHHSSTTLVSIPVCCYSAGMVRVFLTSGRGGVGISDQDCQEPGLYVLATSEEPKVSSTRACCEQQL